MSRKIKNKCIWNVFPNSNGKFWKCTKSVVKLDNPELIYLLWFINNYEQC